MVAPVAQPILDGVSVGAWLRQRRGLDYAIIGVTTAAFLVLFIDPLISLGRQWWNDPDAGHGLLLAPVAGWLAWKAGLHPARRAQRGWGTALLVAAVLSRATGALAAELFTQRFAAWIALLGLVVFAWGWQQVRAWWLPLTVLLLSIPLPAVVVNRLAIPLQFRASALGTALIEWREIPVRTNGNVISIPGQRLFVAEACSGLRSLTALLSLGVLAGGIYLRTIPARFALLLLTIPVAIAVNGARIFLTAFLMYFVDPALGRGFMHTSEGWAMFVVALLAIAGIALVLERVERPILRRLGVRGA